MVWSRCGSRRCAPLTWSRVRWRHSSGCSGRRSGERGCAGPLAGRSRCAAGARQLRARGESRRRPRGGAHGSTTSAARPRDAPRAALGGGRAELPTGAAARVSADDRTTRQHGLARRRTDREVGPADEPPMLCASQAHLYRQGGTSACDPRNATDPDEPPTPLNHADLPWIPFALTSFGGHDVGSNERLSRT